MKEDPSIKLTMIKSGPMQFTTTFDKVQYPDLLFDEPKSSGGNDDYPSAGRILTAAIMNCLSASFTYCLMRSRFPLDKNFELTVTASVSTVRNDDGRLRIPTIRVILKPVFRDGLPKELKKKFERCKRIFQDYCTVSASIKHGIDIQTTFDK